MEDCLKRAEHTQRRVESGVGAEQTQAARCAARGAGRARRTAREVFLGRVASSVVSGSVTVAYGGSPPTSRPSAVETGVQGLSDATVARPALFEPFRVDQAQRFAQAIDQAGRRGVVVQSLGAPVRLELQQVEIAGSWAGASGVQQRFDVGRIGDQGHARWRADGVVDAGHAGVDAPVVDAELARRRAAWVASTISCAPCAWPVRQVPDTVDGQSGRPLARRPVLGAVAIERHDLGAVAPGNVAGFGHEAGLATNGDPVAWLDQRIEQRLEPRRRQARDRESSARCASGTSVAPAP